MIRATGYRNPSYADLECEALRDRNAQLKDAAQALVDCVDRYVRQEVSRTILLNTNAALKDAIRGGAKRMNPKPCRNDV